MNDQLYFDWEYEWFIRDECEGNINNIYKHRNRLRNFNFIECYNSYIEATGEQPIYKANKIIWFSYRIINQQFQIDRIFSSEEIKEYLFLV